MAGEAAVEPGLGAQRSLRVAMAAPAHVPRRGPGAATKRARPYAPPRVPSTSGYMNTLAPGLVGPTAAASAPAHGMVGPAASAASGRAETLRACVVADCQPESNSPSASPMHKVRRLTQRKALLCGVPVTVAHMLGFLRDPQDLLRCGLVCRNWLAASRTPQLWQNLARFWFGDRNDTLAEGQLDPEDVFCGRTWVCYAGAAVVLPCRRACR